MNEYDPDEKLANSIVTSAILARKVKIGKKRVVSKLTLTAEMIGNMTYKEFEKYVFLKYPGWTIIEGNSVDPS